MKITLESTDQIAQVDMRLGRIWKGTTESGIEVEAFIPRIAVSSEADQSQFEAELSQAPPPSSPSKAFALLRTI